LCRESSSNGLQKFSFGTIFRFALIATGDLRNACGYVARMNEDWLAVIVGLALLALVLVGAIPGSVIP
jgi:hypothetical protein